MGWACADLRPWAGRARTSPAHVCSTRMRFAAPSSRGCAGLASRTRSVAAGGRPGGLSRSTLGWGGWHSLMPRCPRATLHGRPPLEHRAGRAPGGARSKRGAVHAAVERVSARPAGANVRWAGRICSRWRGGRSGRTARACASASACTRAPPTPASSASSAPDTVSPGHTHGSGPPGHTRLRRVDG